MKNLITSGSEDNCVSYASGLERHYLETGKNLALPKRSLSVKTKLKKLLPDGLKRSDSCPKSPSLNHLDPFQCEVPQAHDDQPIASGSEEILIISTPETREAARLADIEERRIRFADMAALARRLTEEAFAMAKEKEERLKQEALAKTLRKLTGEEDNSKGKGKISEEVEHFTDIAFHGSAGKRD
ncbi:hypothetical protein DFH28DRAFT_929373 [Melampsora americana]|nr:hypothetical protein DFH28DRAFT_929373 [Melampsora americana]